MNTRTQGILQPLSLALALALAPTLLACGGDGTGESESSNESGETEEEEETPASTRNHLLWKRYHAVEQDLSRALEIEPDALCSELGKHSCVHRVHLTTLGGHDPFDQGLFRPLKAPLVTTSLALDRVALSACGARARLDREGAPVVFTELELAGDAPSPDSDAFSATIQTLYRRLLARDPVEDELTELAALVEDDDGAPVSGEVFAATACYAIATTAEFIFY